MNSPLPLPDWVPWWVHLALLLAALLFALLFLLMPFSVFGVKARLEGIEARLDEIQGELRALALRFPEPGPDERARDAFPAYAPHDDDRPPAYAPRYPAAPVRRAAPPRSEPRLP